MHDLVTLRFFYNLGHEYFRFIHSNFGMQGVFGLTQTDTQMQMSDSGIQTNDSDLRNLSHELQQTLKIENDKTDTNTSPNNNISYNNKRSYNRNYHSGKKEHKNMHYRGHGGRYQHRGGNNGSGSGGGGNAKKDQTSHLSSPSSSSQPQSHHNQAHQSSTQQQQQHQHLHNDSGNAQSEYNSPNVSERFDMPPPIDFYQVYIVLKILYIYIRYIIDNYVCILK